MKSRRLSEDAAYALLRKTADAARCNLGLTPLAFETIAPFSLGLGGNYVTISNAVWGRMAAHGAETDLDPARVGLALLAATRFASPSPAFGSARSLSCRRPSWPTRWPRTASMTTASVNPGTRLGRSRHRPHRHRHGAAVAEQPGEGDWLRKAWAQENPEALA